MRDWNDLRGNGRLGCMNESYIGIRWENSTEILLLYSQLCCGKSCLPSILYFLFLDISSLSSISLSSFKDVFNLSLKKLPFLKDILNLSAKKYAFLPKYRYQTFSKYPDSQPHKQFTPTVSYSPDIFSRIYKMTVFL